MSCWRFRAAAVDSASFWILIYSLRLHVFLHLFHALGKTLQTLALCHWLPLQLLPWKGERHKSYLSEISCIDPRLILLFWSAFENCPGTGKHNKAMLKCCLFAQLNPLCTIRTIFASDEGCVERRQEPNTLPACNGLFCAPFLAQRFQSVVNLICNMVVWTGFGFYV